jgi:excisionase family DNA binding protein
MSETVPTMADFQALADRVAELEARLTSATTTTPEWLTIPVAANYLGLSQDAVYKLVNRHGIDKHQEVRGGRIILRRTELDAALANRNRTTTP